MAVHKICLERCLPSGITNSCNTPCAFFNFSTEILRETFRRELPEYLVELNDAFNKIPLGQISGLAPTWQGGPVDRCVIDGTWNPQQQALHGGPIPMMSGAPGSRGVPEKWPHTAAQHMMQIKSDASWKTGSLKNCFAETNSRFSKGTENGSSTQGINLGRPPFSDQPSWTDTAAKGSKCGGGLVPA